MPQDEAETCWTEWAGRARPARRAAPPGARARSGRAACAAPTAEMQPKWQPRDGVHGAEQLAQLLAGQVQLSVAQLQLQRCSREVCSREVQPRGAAEVQPRGVQPRCAAERWQPRGGRPGSSPTCRSYAKTTPAFEEVSTHL